MNLLISANPNLILRSDSIKRAGIKGPVLFPPMRRVALCHFPSCFIDLNPLTGSESPLVKRTHSLTQGACACASGCVCVRERMCSITMVRRGCEPCVVGRALGDVGRWLAQVGAYAGAAARLLCWRGGRCVLFLLHVPITARCPWSCCLATDVALNNWPPAQPLAEIAPRYRRCDRVHSRQRRDDIHSSFCFVHLLLFSYKKMLLKGVKIAAIVLFLSFGCWILGIAQRSVV